MLTILTTQEKKQKDYWIANNRCWLQKPHSISTKAGGGSDVKWGEGGDEYYRKKSEEEREKGQSENES